MHCINICFYLFGIKLAVIISSLFNELLFRVLQRFMLLWAFWLPFLTFRSISQSEALTASVIFMACFISGWFPQKVQCFSS